MAWLVKIIEQIEKNFKVHVHGSIDKNYRIESVQFLIPSNNNDNFTLTPNTLYIGNYQDLCSINQKVPILLLNCQSISSNENILYIYQKLDPMQVCNCIQQEILRSRQNDLKKEEILNVLEAGYGIQAIIDTARKFFQNPITICSTSFSIIAVSSNEDDYINFEIYKDKKYIKKSSLQNMRNSKVIERIFKSHTAFITQFENEPGLDYLFCGIHIHRATVGYICLRSTVRSFTEDDLSLVIDLSKILSIEMQKDDFFKQKSGLIYEYFLADLLECNIDNIEFIKQYLMQLNQPFYKYFWVFTFSFSSESTNYLNPKHYIDQLLSFFHNSMAFFYKGALVMLLTSNNLDPFIDIDMQSFLDFLEINQMYAAVSYRYENILETYIYYKQAMYILQDKNSIYRNRIVFYSDNFLHYILGQYKDNMFLKSCIHPDIIFLINYDKINNTNYSHTLKCYLENGRNALRTANHLHIHKSTFFYRLGKISELLGSQIENSKELFAYEFSFAVIDYIKDSKPFENE